MMRSGTPGNRVPSRGASRGHSRSESRGHLRSADKMSSRSDVSSRGSLLDWLPRTAESQGGKQPQTRAQPSQGSMLVGGRIGELPQQQAQRGQKARRRKRLRKSYHNSLMKSFRTHTLEEMIPSIERAIPDAYHLYDGAPFSVEDMHVDVGMRMRRKKGEGGDFTDGTASVLVKSSKLKSPGGLLAKVLGPFPGAQGEIERGREQVDKIVDGLDEVKLAPGKMFPSRLPTTREEVKWLESTLKSMLVSFRQDMKAEPRAIAHRALRKADTNGFLEVVQPEMAILQTAMDEITRQVHVSCKERGELLYRVQGRQRELYTNLVKMVGKIQRQRVKVEDYIPSVRKNRKLMINAMKALRDSCADEDNEELWSAYLESMEALHASGGTREYGVLSAVADVVTQLRTEVRAAKAEVAATTDAKTKVEEAQLEMITVMNEERSNMNKLVKALKKQIRATEENRDEIISKAIDETYRRARSDGENALHRAKGQKDRLQHTVESLQSQMAKLRQANNVIRVDQGTQVELENIYAGSAGGPSASSAVDVNQRSNYQHTTFSSRGHCEERGVQCELLPRGSSPSRKLLGTWWSAGV